MANHSGLSEIQKINFKNLSGYQYEDGILSGEFSTDRPYNKDDWTLSPWHFTFVFQPETGYLFCELDHRMTNNRAIGWDQDGNELELSLVNKVYPPHM